MAQFILWACMYKDNLPGQRPVGPHALAHWLRQHGYTVKVIDFCHAIATDDLCEITRRHIDSHTIGIGVSSTFWEQKHQQIMLTHDIRVKEEDGSEPVWVKKARTILGPEYPHLEWVLGGANAALPQKKYEWHVIQDYGEDGLLKFLDEKSKLNKLHRSPFDIQMSNCVATNDLGIQSHEPWSFETSRGCQFRCRFCRFGLLGKTENSYIREAKRIEDDFLYNYENFGITRYVLTDDTVNESDEKIAALAETAQRLPFELEWVGFNRLDLICRRPHSVDQLQASGLKSAYFGIESFNPKASRLVGKGWNGKEGKDFLLGLLDRWQGKFNCHLSFLVGLPGETPQEVEETHQWCLDNDIASWDWFPLNVTANENILYRSTFDKEAERFGFRFPDPADHNNWVNDDWTFDEANTLALRLRADAQAQKKQPAAFHLSELAALGYEYDEILTWESVPWHELFGENGKIEVFLRNYVQSQL